MRIYVVGRTGIVQERVERKIMDSHLTYKGKTYQVYDKGSSQLKCIYPWGFKGNKGKPLK